MEQSSPSRFPTTQWTDVERAGRADTSAAPALSQLLTAYLEPLRTHLLIHKRLPAQRADDLLQSFVADCVLDRNLVGDAVRGRGRFRTFLLVALDRFVAGELRKERRKKRAPDSLIALEDASDPQDQQAAPDQIFEIAWARQVLINAAQRMRRQCEIDGRQDIWGIFDARVLGPTLEGAEQTPYPQLVEQYRLLNADIASNLLVTGKRMFARSLEGVIGEYMTSGGEIQQEIAELREILSRGRVQGSGFKVQ